MDWKDNRQGNIVYFDDIRIGNVFVWNDIIHIKINCGEAFDIYNNIDKEFLPNELVEERKATLVLD